MDSISTAQTSDETRRAIRNRSDEIAASKGYYYDSEAAEHVLQFAQQFCQVEPLPWQADVLRRIFGWMKPDGSRRFRRGYVSTAKKNGKTLISSVISLYMLLCSGESQPAAVISAANSRQQAAGIFKDLELFAFRSRSLKRYLKVIPSTKSITGPNLSSYRAISREAGTVDGIRANCAIYDEYHHAKDALLFTILAASGKGYAEPLFLTITTSGGSLTTPCGDEYNTAKRIAAGDLLDDSELTYFVAIYEAEDSDDPAKPETWRKANPAIGHTISEDEFRADWLQASTSPTRLAIFKRLHLNMWVDADEVGAWLVPEEWEQCRATDITPDMLVGRECFAAVDLSATRDVTAVGLLFPWEDGRYVYQPHFWLPKHNLQAREKRDGTPYGSWAADPAHNLHLTDGDAADYAAVQQGIRDLAQSYRIKEIAIDRWNAHQTITTLSAEGFTIVPYGQGFGSMSAPSKELERLVISRRLVHFDNPLLNHMAAKVVVEVNAAGDIKPSKAKSSHRIDGIVTAVMSLGRAMNHQPEYTGDLTA